MTDVLSLSVPTHINMMVLEKINFLSQRICTVAGPAILRRILNHSSQYWIKLDIALTNK